MIEGAHWPLRDLWKLCILTLVTFCTFADCKLALVTFCNFPNGESALRTFPNLSEIALQPCNFVIQHL